MLEVWKRAQFRGLWLAGAAARSGEKREGGKAESGNETDHEREVGIFEDAELKKTGRFPSRETDPF